MTAVEPFGFELAVTVPLVLLGFAHLPVPCQIFRGLMNALQSGRCQVTKLIAKHSRMTTMQFSRMGEPPYGHVFLFGVLECMWPGRDYACRRITLTLLEEFEWDAEAC